MKQGGRVKTMNSFYLPSQLYPVSYILPFKIVICGKNKWLRDEGTKHYPKNRSLCEGDANARHDNEDKELKFMGT
jgi:hypothetical protein